MNTAASPQNDLPVAAGDTIAAAPAGPKGLPNGWHEYPKESPKKTGLYVVRQKTMLGPVRLSIVHYCKVAVSVPGAMVVAFGFTSNAEEIMQDVEAWRVVPQSWQE